MATYDYENDETFKATSLISFIPPPNKFIPFKQENELKFEFKNERELRNPLKFKALLQQYTDQDQDKFVDMKTKMELYKLLEITTSSPISKLRGPSRIPLSTYPNEPFL